MKKSLLFVLVFIFGVSIFAQEESIETSEVIETIENTEISKATRETQIMLGAFCEPFIPLGRNFSPGIEYGIDFSARIFYASWFSLNYFARFNFGAIPYFVKSCAFIANELFPMIGDQWVLAYDAWVDLFNGEHPLWVLINAILLGAPVICATLWPVAITPILLGAAGVSFLSPFSLGVDAEFHLFRNNLVDTFLAAGLSNDPAKANVLINIFSDDKESEFFMPLWPLIGLKAGAQLNLPHFAVNFVAAFETSAILAGTAIYYMIEPPEDLPANESSKNDLFSIFDFSFKLCVVYKF